MAETPPPPAPRAPANLPPPRSPLERVPIDDLLLVFVLSLGFYVTPAVLGGGRVIMVSMKITDIIEIHFNWGAASALGVVLLIMTLGILWAASRLLKLDRILGGGGQ